MGRILHLDFYGKKKSLLIIIRFYSHLILLALISG